MVVNLLLLLVCWSVLCAEGHIHSQKVRHIERERVTMATWTYSVASSVLVGGCGVFPLIVNRWVNLDREGEGGPALKVVLGFAVGGLLGDVFLHLLPEAWSMHQVDGGGGWEGRIGLWVLAGLLSFMIVEKVAQATERSRNAPAHTVHSATTATATSGGHQKPPSNGIHTQTLLKQNGHWRTNSSTVCNGIEHLRSRGLTNGCPNFLPTPPADHSSPSSTESKWLHKDISGYLNLLANCTDNFTHGLAIAASYVASPTVGVLTTLAILCHEIPHEIGDFAILLNSGFDLHRAAILQMVTACGGVVGVVAGLTAEHMGNAASWLLPFTAGGFLYIALVSIVPELLEDTTTKACLTQLLGVATGVVVMALVIMVEKKSCSHMPISQEHWT